MRLNGKDEAKGQGDDETKIYDGYICLIELSTAAMSLVPPLRVSSNRIAATKTSRANRVRLAPNFFPSPPLEVGACPHALNEIRLALIRSSVFV